MTSIETLDFNQSDSMVAIDDKKNDNPQAPMPEAAREVPLNTYNDQREKLANNNVDKEQMMELATPLSEVMEMPQPPTQQQVMPNPRMGVGPQTQEQLMNQPFVEAPPMGGAQQQQVVPPNQNPGNLTDEQMDALLVGITAAIAFSPQTQERLVQYVPSFFNEAGVRTIGGTVATGAIAAGIFLMVKRFILKN